MPEPVGASGGVRVSVNPSLSLRGRGLCTWRPHFQNRSRSVNMPLNPGGHLVDDQSVDTEPQWVTAPAAVSYLTGVVGDIVEAQETLIKRAGANMIATRCARQRVAELATDHITLTDAREVHYPFWRLFESSNVRITENWKLGDFELFQTLPNGQSKYVAIFSVEFALPAELRSGPPPIPPADTTASPPPLVEQSARNVGGRPRKGWWDDLWIELIRRIQAGKLNPTSAAQLENIMNDWLTQRGYSPGDSTTKPTALKLFNYLKENRG